MVDIKNNEPIEWVMEEIILCTIDDFDLVRLSEERSGFCNSDGGHGVAYPEELDGYQRIVEGIEIPPGYVWMFGRANFPGNDPGYEFFVPESRYLAVLAKVLEQEGYKEKAKAVRENRTFAQPINPADA